VAPVVKHTILMPVSHFRLQRFDLKEVPLACLLGRMIFILFLLISLYQIYQNERVRFPYLQRAHRLRRPLRKGVLVSALYDYTFM
jgi:hypothetical protein